jgi:ribosomal protein S18 acetylase RimI-like enzyme
MSDVTLRPMRPDDGDLVDEVVVDAFTAAASRARDVPMTPDDVQREATNRRVAHAVAHDPQGCWIAERNGAPVGAAMALVREDLWILSMLMVRGEAQGQGVGRALIDRALSYADGRTKGLIAASHDPAGWRRYWSAGFRLSPAAFARGTVDRAALPVVDGVREGSPGDYERSQELSRRLRGAAHGPDLAFLAEQPGGRFWVSDRPGDAGFAVAFRGSPALLAAESEAAGQRLLWTVLAEAEEKVTFYFVTGAQQWAFDVCFRAGLAVRPGTGLFTRGDLGPLTPYLPNGPFL